MTKKTPRRSWGKSLNLFVLGGLIVDLAIYFGFAWWTVPLVFLGSFLAHEGLGRKIFGTGTGMSVFTGFSSTAVVVWAKIYAPDLLRSEEEISLLLKWILP